MAPRPYAVTILPKQATRIAAVAIQTGAAIGLSQSGSTITIHTGKETFSINAQGHPITPGPRQEQLLAEEDHHLHQPVH